MQLTEVDRLPWKEVMVKYQEKTGKSLKVPALQMRKKRLVERLRVWTPSDERALSLALQDQDKGKWEQVAQSMMKYGCIEKWSKETIERKWRQLHPDHDDFPSEYDANAKHQGHVNDDYGQEDWSDGVSHSLHDSESGPMSAVSTATMDEVRDRQAHEADAHHLHLLQRQMMFDQHQHNPWGHENS